MYFRSKASFCTFWFWLGVWRTGLLWQNCFCLWIFDSSTCLEEKPDCRLPITISIFYIHKANCIFPQRFSQFICAIGSWSPAGVNECLLPSLPQTLHYYCSLLSLLFLLSPSIIVSFHSSSTSRCCFIMKCTVCVYWACFCPRWKTCSQKTSKVSRCVKTWIPPEPDAVAAASCPAAAAEPRAVGPYGRGGAPLRVINHNMLYGLMSSRKTQRVQKLSAFWLKVFRFLQTQFLTRSTWSHAAGRRSRPPLS